MNRGLTLKSAVITGLGSIIGTGLFVGAGLALGVAGGYFFTAVGLALFVALLSSTSIMRLNAGKTSGGNGYDYGSELLGHSWGVSAGWMFLLAKSATTATAALGLAGYAGWVFGYTSWFRMVFSAIVILMIVFVLATAGVQRSMSLNKWIMYITFSALTVFVVAGLGFGDFRENLLGGNLIDQAHLRFGYIGLFHAAALMFVAFAGFGRLTKLGQEINQPEKNIPRLIAISLFLSGLIYIIVYASALSLTDSDALYEATTGYGSPLYAAATYTPIPAISYIIILGAGAAMFGVILNLAADMSQIILSASKKGDIPEFFKGTITKTGIHAGAIWMGFGVTAILTLSGNLMLTWSVAAFALLLYYCITNLCAFQAERGSGMAQILPAAGCILCLFLAFTVGALYWIIGLAVMASGLIIQMIRRKTNI